MSILNDLSILAAGTGKGYRAGQALERELSEMRRKALLEERATRVQEDEASTLGLLRQAQSESEHAQARQSGAQTDEMLRRSKHLTEPFHSAFSFDVMGNKLPAKNMEDITDLDSLLGHELSSRASMYNSEFGGRTPLTKQEMRLRALTAIQGNPTLLEGADPALYGPRLNKAWDISLQSMPELMTAADSARYFPPDSAATDTSRTRGKLSEAEKRKRYNRFVKSRKK